MMPSSLHGFAAAAPAGRRTPGALQRLPGPPRGSPAGGALRMRPAPPGAPGPAPRASAGVGEDGGGAAGGKKPRRRKVNIQGSKARKDTSNSKRRPEEDASGAPPAPDALGAMGAFMRGGQDAGEDVLGLGAGMGGGMGTMSDLPMPPLPKERAPIVDVNLGPLKPPDEPGQAPDWVTLLEEEAKTDPELAELLEGANGDPKVIEERARKRLEEANLRIFDEEDNGAVEPMKVVFREFDQFNLWLWWEMTNVPGEREKQLMEEVVQAWFLVGKLGGYNALNMQLMNAGIDLGTFEYDEEEQESALPAVFHNIGDLELSPSGTWARCWFDLGTADQFALDVLINALANLSKEYVGIKQLIIGGKAVGDWTVPAEDQMADSLMYSRENTDLNY